MILDTIKRWVGGRAAVSGGGEYRVLSAWAKEEGHRLKTVSGSPPGVVVETSTGWRVEWGPSQRPYFQGAELRFRFDAGLSPDVQMLWLSKSLAQTLESDVFLRFTDAMQTRVDNSLPEEMRWLAMHAKVTLSQPQILARRFLLLSNAEAVSRQWLDPELTAALEEAATSWWTDNLVMVLTVNRGMLTARMSGQQLDVKQLQLVGRLFEIAAAKLVNAG